MCGRGQSNFSFKRVYAISVRSYNIAAVLSTLILAEGVASGQGNNKIRPYIALFHVPTVLITCQNHKLISLT